MTSKKTNNTSSHADIAASTASTVSGKNKKALQKTEEHSIGLKALRESRDQLQATLDSSLEMIQVFKAVRDKHGKIVDFVWVLNNHAATKKYDNVIGKSLIKNNPGVLETGIFDKLVAVTETGIAQQYEQYYPYEQFNGWFYQSVVKVEDGVATSTSDITERKKAEQEIIYKSKELASLHSELATFNNIAANDYKVTIQSLYLYLENIIKAEAQHMGNTGKSNLRKAQSAVQKLNLLTEDIIAFSKLQHLNQNFSVLNLESILNETIEDMAEKIQQRQAIITVDVKLPEINGYPLLVALLFHHLLDNALKFHPEGQIPKISITTDKVKSNAISEKLPEAEFHQVCFVDNGIGFPEEEATNIFDIFYRLHEKKTYRGSGVGLAVCKKIMDMHGGFITAEINEGGGACFCCHFPVKTK